MKVLVLLWVLCLWPVLLPAQTFTMGKKCRELNAGGIELLKQKNYTEALAVFEKMQSSCNTKDAKEARAVGKAEALNGLGRHEEAIAASEEALKVTKNKSLMGFFQKAVAQNKLKQYDASAATFSQMLALTEKNRDTKARASNYALMASVQYRQLNNVDSAGYYLEKAMRLDSANANYVVQKGDFLVGEKKYDEGFTQYDKALQMGKPELDIYSIKSKARIKMLQEKYGTTNAQELRSKLTATEKQALCGDLKKAIALGLNDMTLDMFASLVCK